MYSRAGHFLPKLYLEIYDLRWELAATKDYEKERRQQLQDQIDAKMKKIATIDSETVYFKG